MRARLSLLGGGLALLALLTVSRMPVWVSDLTLWRNAVAENPTDPRSLINYGVALQETGHASEAERLYQQAITLAAPADSLVRDAHAAAVASLDLATVYANARRWPDAQAMVRRSQHYEPTLHDTKLERDLLKAIE